MGNGGHIERRQDGTLSAGAVLTATAHLSGSGTLTAGVRAQEPSGDSYGDTAGEQVSHRDITGEQVGEGDGAAEQISDGDPAG